MRFTIVFALLITLAAPAAAPAQTAGGVTVAEPFNLGTFQINGSPHVGIVLRNSIVVNLNAANAALELNPAYPKVPAPADMLELIGRYEYGMQRRLYEIVNDLVAGNRLTGAARPDFVYGLDHVRTLAPIL
jgi:hypothetical protein